MASCRSTMTLACGLQYADIRRLCRAGRWRRLFPRTYLVDADFLTDVPRRAWLQAALLSYGRHACLVGSTAAEVLGIQGLPPDPSTVWLGLLPSTSRLGRRGMPVVASSVPDAGVRVTARVRQFVLAPNEVTAVDGLPATVAPRTLADTILGLDRIRALCVLDSALNLGKVTAADVANLGELCAGRRGVQRLRTWLSLVDGRAESPLETRIRIACIDGGVSPDDVQYTVRNRWGVILGRGDLAWWRGRRRPFVAEADGREPHERPAALFHDRHRANDFTLADVDMVRFTWADSCRPAYVASVVRTGLAREAP